MLQMIQKLTMVDLSNVTVKMGSNTCDISAPIICITNFTTQLLPN